MGGGVTENVISQDGSDKHIIQRYSFRTIVSLDDDTLIGGRTDPREGVGEQIHPGNNQPPPQPQAPPPQAHVIPPPAPSIDKEIVERLLSKTDELSGSLAKMQHQIENQQKDIEKKLEAEVKKAFDEGYLKGKEDAKNELQAQIDESRSAYTDSINTIMKASKGFESSLSGIEKELSSIAVDISKEVIVAEVKERGQEIALELVKSLVDSLKEANSITIKLNPNDFAFVKEKIEPDKRVKLEADKAIAKGGVVIISDVGNIDGTVMTRYQTLKQSILESKVE